MKRLLILVLILMFIESRAQQTENVFLITLDGLRWQELFGGADSLLIDDSGYVEDVEELVDQYWAEDSYKRRERLMPFFWSTIAEEGQLYGNRHHGSRVDCTNEMWFSYPGYNEILTGFADDERITSNDKINNPNRTILEILNKRQDFESKVAAFGSWDVFPYIINRERSGVSVNAGFEKALDNLSERESFLNKIQDEIRGPWGSVRLDVFTHHYAMEHLKKHKPRVLYIAYGETDDFAHDGEYDQYLKSATQTDEYIRELWDFAQSDPQYQGKTTMIITTDHGRGVHPKSNWKSHNKRISGAGQIWIAAIGPDTSPLGEMKNQTRLYQNQVAATVMQALGEAFDQPKAGKPIDSVLK